MFHFRSIAFSALIISVCLFAFAPSVQARSIFDILFGSSEEQTGPGPEVTLQAPFAHQIPNDAQNNELMDMYGKDSQEDAEGNSLRLSQPHRSPEEISRWGSSIVVQALTLNASGWDSIKDVIAADFSAYGLQEYKAYLDRMRIFETLEKNNMRIQTIADGSAQVLREGLISGTYHWLVQIPVMVTFYNKNIKRIVNKRDQIGQNQKMVIQIQIGRTPKKDGNQLGIEIERWIVTAS
jgi:hypothetical protein